MTNTEKVDAFFPLEAVKELAEKRALVDEWAKTVEECQTELEVTSRYMILHEAERKLGIATAAVIKAEAAFRAGCEDIFIETKEKEYPGGKIKMRTVYEYSEAEAVDWAIRHELIDLLKLDNAKFKKTVSGTLPIFVIKKSVGTMYIDSDLSKHLEGSDEEKKS